MFLLWLDSGRSPVSRGRMRRSIRSASAFPHVWMHRSHVHSSSSLQCYDQAWCMKKCVKAEQDTRSLLQQTHSLSRQRIWMTGDNSLTICRGLTPHQTRLSFESRKMEFPTPKHTPLCPTTTSLHSTHQLNSHSSRGFVRRMHVPSDNFAFTFLSAFSQHKQNFCVTLNFSPCSLQALATWVRLNPFP